MHRAVAWLHEDGKLIRATDDGGTPDLGGKWTPLFDFGTLPAIERALASAQRGKEAAEQRYNQLEGDNRQAIYALQQSEQAFLKLQARLDAAEKLMKRLAEVADVAADSANTGIMDGAIADVRGYFEDAALSSSPSTSAVPEKEEAK